MTQKANLEIPSNTRAGMAPTNHRELIENSTYPESCKRTLKAFLDLIDANGWSHTEAAKKVKRADSNKSALAPSSLSLLFKGTYGADPTTLCKAIDRTLNLEIGRAGLAGKDIVPVRLYTVAKEQATIAVATGKISCVHGGLYCGKTIAATRLLHEYMAATPIFLTCPHGDTYGGFIKRLATVRGIPLKGTLSSIREAIIQSFDDSYLLIVDSFHEPLLNYSYSQGVRVISFLKELNELTRCPMILFGSTEGFDTLQSSGYQEFEKRIVGACDIAAKKTDMRPGFGPDGDSDLRRIADSFGLENPTASQLQFCRDVIQGHSLGRLFDLLKLASVDRKKMTWQKVIGLRQNQIALN